MDRERIAVLGVKFDNVSMQEAVDRLESFLQSEGTKCVYTPNPEIVMAAQKNEKFMNILNNADLLVPDGIGVVKAAKMLKTPLKERVAGYDMSQALMERMAKTGHTAYFFGAGPEVAEKAAKNMMEKYEGLRIVGVRNGYFNKEDELAIIEGINRLSPDLLLVGLGAPKQEKWIEKNKKKLNVKIMIGVGGSFDGFAGNVKRAPAWMIKCNLEWFYRLLKQPSRFLRFLVLPVFVVKVFFSKFKKGEGNGSTKG